MTPQEYQAVLRQLQNLFDKLQAAARETQEHPLWSAATHALRSREFLLEDIQDKGYKIDYRKGRWYVQE